MNFKFELLGFCVDKDFGIKSFWFGSFTIYTLDDTNGTEWHLLILGRIQKKWSLELFGRWMFGPKEVFLADKPTEKKEIKK